MKPTRTFIKPIVVVVMAVTMLGASFQSAAATKNSPVRMIPENFSALAKEMIGRHPTQRIGHDFLNLIEKNLGDNSN